MSVPASFRPSSNGRFWLSKFLYTVMIALAAVFVVVKLAEIVSIFVEAVTKNILNISETTK